METAKAMRMALNDVPLDVWDIARKIAEDVPAGKVTKSNAVLKLKNASRYLRAKPDNDVAEIVDNIVASNKKGNIYSVIIHKGKTPDSYDYLKWDESVSESAKKKVQSNIDDTFKKFYGSKRYEAINSPENVMNFLYVGQQSGQKTTGQDLYRRLSAAIGSDKAASEFLLRAGIDGIDYPAGSLSGQKSGARNYVVFDPNAITIESVESPQYMYAGRSAKGYPYAGRRFSGLWDKQERFEINDQDSYIIEEGVKKLFGTGVQAESITLKEIFGHGHLYTNYPELADAKVTLTADNRVSGAYNEETGEF
jgi:hypothetical protein